MPVNRVLSGVAPQENVNGIDYLTGVLDISAGSNSTLVSTVNGYVYAWGQNNYGQLGKGAVSSSENTPVLVGGGASSLMQITEGSVTAAISQGSLGSYPADVTLAYGQDIIYSADPHIQPRVDDAILNNPATDSGNPAGYPSRGKTVSYDDLPVSVDLTVSQTLRIDATKVIEESYKGYNLYWDKTVETATAANLHWFSSDPGIITIDETADSTGFVTVTPTGERTGRAVIYVVDSSNELWGSMAVNVYYEGINTESAPIVSNAKVISGDGYSFAIQWDGSVWAWGDNNRALLGVNAETSSATPVDSFTWKYYTHAELDTLVTNEATAPTVMGAYYQRLLDVSAANGDSGAAAITGLTNVGQTVISLEIPTTVSKLAFSNSADIVADTLPVVGLENASSTFQNGVFTTLTVKKGIRAVAPRTFANVGTLRDIYWSVTDATSATVHWDANSSSVYGTDADTVIYLAADAFGGTTAPQNVQVPLANQATLPANYFASSVNVTYNNDDQEEGLVNSDTFNTPMQVMGVDGNGLLGDITTSYNDAIVDIAATDRAAPASIIPWRCPPTAMCTLGAATVRASWALARSLTVRPFPSGYWLETAPSGTPTMRPLIPVM